MTDEGKEGKLLQFDKQPRDLSELLPQMELKLDDEELAAIQLFAGRSLAQGARLEALARDLQRAQVAAATFGNVLAVLAKAAPGRQLRVSRAEFDEHNAAQERQAVSLDYDDVAEELVVTLCAAPPDGEEGHTPKPPEPAERKPTAN